MKPTRWIRCRRFERYVTDCYKDHLKKEGKPEQFMADMDVEEALDMLSAQGKWSKCLDVARSHGPTILHKYVALYATDLLRVRSIDYCTQCYESC